MKLSDLRGILQYVPRFRERIFVVAVDGEIVGSENFPNILMDVAVLRSLSIKVILVHGAGWQIRRLAEERGIEPSNTDGAGVTDLATLRLAVEAAVGVTNDIMQGLTTVDLRASYANAVIAHPMGILGGVDFLYTGRVERIDTKSLHLFLAEGIVPVVPPIGFDGEGNTYRVNSDSIAVEVAEAMQAMKIIFLMPGDDMRVGGKVLHQLSIAETEDVVRRKRVDSPRMISKLEHAVRACRSGVPRVHLLDGRLDEALLAEVFSHEGIGTMVYSNEYQQIRRIFKKDVRAIMALIRQSVEDEELIRRTRADIIQHIDDYWVMEIDRTLVACVALHVYPAHKTGELACLYVGKSHENQGHGQRLLAFVENLAQEKGVDRLFALSTRAFMYFQQKGGFREVPPDVLPPERRERYEASGRKSKILMKTLRQAAGEPARRA